MISEDKNESEVNASYASLDGGDTQGLLDIINTSSSGQSKNALKSASPYVSDEVLIWYAATTPPSGHFKQVILANSPVTFEVMEVIDAMNLPNGIRNQINAAQTGIADRFQIDQEISFFDRQVSLAQGDLQDYYLRDTVIVDNLDSMIAVLETDNGTVAQMQLTSAYAENEQYADARDVVSSLSDPLFDSYVFVQSKLIDLAEQNFTYEELLDDSIFISDLTSLAEDTTKHGYADAMVLSELLTGARYYEHIEEEAPVARMQNTNEEDKSDAFGNENAENRDINKDYHVTNYPNPFDGSTTIEVTSAENGTLTISDLMGRTIKTTKVTQGISLINIGAQELLHGVYYCNLLIDGKTVTSWKMIKL